MSQDWKKQYVPWFRLAKQVLTGLLPPVPDREVPKWVSGSDWAILPVEGEESAEDAKNRPYPNIYFRISNGTMTIGLVCNTIKSIDRVRNILNPFHSPEKQEFLACLQKLDDSFKTWVSTKVKEYNPRQQPDYEPDPDEKRSNQLIGHDFQGLFIRADRIHSEGLDRKRREGKSWLPESPSLTLARTSFKPDPTIFKDKLTQLKPLYEVLLRIRSTGQIERATRKGRTLLNPFLACYKCDYKTLDTKVKFCPRDGSRLFVSR